MEQEVNLHNGGSAVVMVGTHGMVPEFQTHPAIKFIVSKDVNGGLEEHYPPNTRAVIITDGINRMHYMFATSYCRQRNIPFLIRKSNQAVYETLKGFFPPPPKVDRQQELAEVKENITKGKLNALIPFIDFNLSNQVNARNLARKANEMGIRTTEGSLVQLVSKQRRAGSKPAEVKSAKPALDRFVDDFESVIKTLEFQKDYIVELVEENRILKAKLEKYKKAMEALNE